MSKLPPTSLVVLTLLGSGCGGLEGKSVSGFASDDDGWRIVGDAQSTTVKPDYNGTGAIPTDSSARKTT